MRYCNVPYIFPVFICVQTRRMRREYGQKAVSFSQFISLIFFPPTEAEPFEFTQLKCVSPAFVHFEVSFIIVVSANKRIK